MRTLLRISIIVLAALAVTGATYVVSQSTWATERFAAAPGGEGGEGRPERGTPPDFSGESGRRSGNVGRHGGSIERGVGRDPAGLCTGGAKPGAGGSRRASGGGASLAAGFAGRGEGGGGEGGGGFNAAALSTFTRILLPIALMIGWGCADRNRLQPCQTAPHQGDHQRTRELSAQPGS